MRLFLTAIAAFLLLSCNNNPAQKQASRFQTNSGDLNHKIAAIINGKDATVGVAIKDLDDGDSLYILADTPHFAMMSVCKFPQALLLLHLADSGKYNAAKPIYFGPDDLKQRTGSKILQDHPQPSFSLSLPEVLRYAIGQSDNISSNKIFQLEGGPAAVETYVHSLGIRDMGVATDYAHLNASSYGANWCTPRAMMQLLEKFYHNQLLSDGSKAMLWKAMIEATSGPDRIKGLLPAGTPVAHKTGTSSRDEASGIMPATNDIGIVQLPNGRHFGVAVFVSESKETDSVNADIIARISRAAWDYFLAKQKH